MPNATFTLRSPMPVSAEELYAWHSRPLAFQRLQPPWEHIEMKSVSSTLDTRRVKFRTPFLGPFKTTWIAEMFGFQPGKQFQDREVQGPFAFWNHTHRFLADGPESSFLEEFIEYRVPLGILGRLLASRSVRRRLAAAFAYRHALTLSDLRRHNLFRDQPRLTIAVTGSRGMVGSELVPFLTTGGHRVVRWVTGKAAPPFDDGTRWLNWNPAAIVDPAMFEGVDAVVHLAGENVASRRWNDTQKRKILESRTIPTRNIAAAISRLPPERRPKAFVCASAVGFYGSRGDEIMTEDSASGEGFFPDVCKAWEDATSPAREAGVRTVNVRVGVVLTPKDGALGKQILPFKAGLGAVLGSGKQWIPWISVNDLVGAIHHCLMNAAISGPVNGCAPTPVTNREFTKTLGQVLRRPAFLWLPRVVLRVLFGQIADDGLQASLRVIPKKLLDTGFTFDHSELSLALRFLLGR